MQSQWSYADIPDQSGRVVLVTGANSGLGFHSVRGLAAKGAQVLLASRSAQRGDRAAAAIRRELPQAQVTVLALDLGDLESVKGCAETVQRDWERLDLLINNAGVMAIPRQETAQGFERQFGVNHLGHFVLTGRLLPLLLKTPDSRIVNVSSLAHRSGHIAFDDLHGVQKYSRFGAYSQSKLANLLFTFELQRRLDRSGAATISAAAHPGFSATNLPFAGPRENQSSIEILVMRALNTLVAQSAEQGALPQLYAATAPDVKGHDFIGPDGWLGMRGYPQKIRARDAAYDEAAARRLWNVSMDLTGETYSLLEV